MLVVVVVAVLARVALIATVSSVDAAADFAVGDYGIGVAAAGRDCAAASRKGHRRSMD